MQISSEYTQIHDMNIHYLTGGCGDTSVLFLHGLPAHSFLWRNVIPLISEYAKVYAPDLPGFGKSDKPDVNYDLSFYTEFVASFIQKMNLKKVIIAGMDLGLMAGLHYAMQHQDNVGGIVMFEGFFVPADEALSNQSFIARLMLKLFYYKKIAQKIIDTPQFAGQMMQSGTIKKLSYDELTGYKKPFEDSKIRKKVILNGVGPHMVARHDAALFKAIEEYSEKLAVSDITKLLLFAEPGAAVSKKTVQAAARIKNLRSVCVGEGRHFLPEDQPDAIAGAIVEFIKAIKQ